MRDTLELYVRETNECVPCSLSLSVCVCCSITNRLEGVLKSHPDVVGVLLLGGTNDCLASLSPSATTLIRVYNPWLKVQACTHRHARQD